MTLTSLLSPILLSVLLLSSSQEQKSPIPPAPAQKESEKVIRDLFKEEYAKRAALERIALAQKLLGQAGQTKDDPASRYVLLREARDIAVQAGDLDLALKAVDLIAAAFEGEVTSMKSVVLANAAKVARMPEELQKIARSFLALSEEAVVLELHDVAEKAVEQASVLSKRAKDVPLATKADTRTKQVADRKARFEKVKKARQTLETNPTDPIASLAVGIYEGPIRGKWEAGLPLLAKGSDPVLKGLAEKELAPPSGAPEQVSLADGWWDVSEKEKDPAVKEGLLKRARHWYRRAFPGTAGLAKAKVEKRMGDALTEQFGGTWIDISDPRGFGQPGKPGDAMQLSPKSGMLVVSLDKMPAGEFDGVMVRITQPLGAGAIAMVFFESQKSAVLFETNVGRFLVLTMKDDGKWKQEVEIPAEARGEYTVTVINTGGEYVHYLDGKEMARQKTKVGKILMVGFQAQVSATFDKLRLRRKE